MPSARHLVHRPGTALHPAELTLAHTVPAMAELIPLAEQSRAVACHLVVCERPCLRNQPAGRPAIQGDTVGEHRQPTGIRERLEPLLVAFLAGLGLGHAWGAGVLDPWRSA